MYERMSARLLSRLALRGRSPRTGAEVLVVALMALALAGGGAFLLWTGRHYYAIWRLTRGVGETMFFGADGRPWFALDEQRRDVPLDQVSPHLRRAVVAIEDRRFYRHGGIDPIALARAAWANLRRGGVAEGGSTITQQLARTLFLTNRRTVPRKAKEAVLAVMLEQVLSKDQILELYLNRVYLGGGVYGVEAMSRRLFARRARDLGLAESALVAGVIQAPSALSPWSNLDGALRRSEVVLAVMREQGLITPAAEKAARAARLRITSSPSLGDARSGYAKEFLRQQFRERVGDDNPPEWQVHTTLVPSLQRAAEQAVQRGLAALDVPGLQAALVAMDPETGDVLALVGGSSFAASPFNRAVHSRRQPGSAFKPFVYAAALERGLSPVSVLRDLHEVAAPGWEEWTPRNAGGEGPDEQALRDALIESNNQAAVALQRRIGTGAVLEVASKAGLAGLPDVPSLALGTGLVTPLDLTAAFCVFANGGMAVRPRAISVALDRQGDVAFRNPVRRRRVISEEASFQMLSMLRDVVERGTASPARSLGLDVPAAGKTGTTNEFKDAWFVGFTSSVVAGVWVGFDQPASIGRSAYAARVALPMWASFMRAAARERPAEEFEVSPGLREATLCTVSHARPVDGCPLYVEYFKEGDDVPSRLCPVHSGSPWQRAERAVDAVLDRLGRRLRRILRW
jgi:penicillin-binding protein 1A